MWGRVLMLCHRNTSILWETKPLSECLTRKLLKHLQVGKRTLGACILLNLESAGCSGTTETCCPIMLERGSSVMCRCKPSEPTQPHTKSNPAGYDRKVRKSGTVDVVFLFTGYNTRCAITFHSSVCIRMFDVGTYDQREIRFGLEISTDTVCWHNQYIGLQRGMIAVSNIYLHKGIEFSVIEQERSLAM